MQYAAAKIFISVQGADNIWRHMIWRMKGSASSAGNIQKVKHLESIGNYDTYQARLREERAHIWGVATGQGRWSISR
jgi:hypothetical protein